MKLGAFMMPLHPPDKDRTECFEEDIDLIVLADELGFTEAWIGQHHTVAWEPIPSNDVFISNVLPRTKNIRLGTVYRLFHSIIRLTPQSVLRFLIISLVAVSIVGLGKAG